MNKYLIFIMIFINGCGYKELYTQTIKKDGVIVSVSIYDIKYKENLATYFVYGKLKIKLNKKKLFVNLNSLKLKINSVNSNKIYIDNIAHINTYNYMITNNTTINVYWTFNNLERVYKKTKKINNVEFYIDDFNKFLMKTKVK